MSKQKLSTTTDNYEQALIDDTYQIGKLIGMGSYGQVRLGKNIKTGQCVAIKLEPLTTSDPQLNTEYETYCLLKNKVGFPVIFYYGHFMENNILIMEKLGCNLEDLFEQCDRRLTLKSILFLTLQLLKRFEVIHSCEILYRDVKPENFMLGTSDHTVHVIDFGLSKSYIDPNSQRHIPYKQTDELVGTTRYMSIRAHQCKEQSRRDDLEALDYVFLYFLRGSLPWSGLYFDDFSEHNERICNMKRDTPDEELFDGFPLEYLFYHQYVRHLEFEEVPNYEKVRNMFKRLFIRQNFCDDGHYDWNNDINVNNNSNNNNINNNDY